MMDSAEQSPRCGAYIAPLIATAALALCLLADEWFVSRHVMVNWPWWLRDIEHYGSEWTNRVLPPAALAVALLVNRPALRHLILALPLQAIITHLLKFAVGRVRPVDGDESLVFAPFSALHDGWPSGHAALAWTIALVFTLRRSRTSPVWIMAALYICWARLQTYAHFPADILAGALVAWIVALSTEGAFHRWIENREAQGRRGDRRGWWRWTVLWLAALVAPIVGAVAIGRQTTTVSDESARREIAVLYRNYLGREPDDPGLAAYSSQRARGLPLIAIARSILDSDESRLRLAEQAPQERTRIVYDLLLHRPPTEEELRRDLPLVTDLSRRRGRLTLLIMRLTWMRDPP